MTYSTWEKPAPFAHRQLHCLSSVSLREQGKKKQQPPDKAAIPGRFDNQILSVRGEEAWKGSVESLLNWYWETGKEENTGQLRIKFKSIPVLVMCFVLNQFVLSYLKLDLLKVS